MMKKRRSDIGREISDEETEVDRSRRRDDEEEAA
jgi:hypothetical protein